MEMDIEFEIDLGHGWYMDSTGRLHQSVVPGAPVYQLAGGLPFDAKKIGEVLSQIASAMPKKDDPKSIEKFQKLGVPDETIKLLAALGAAASAASMVVAIFAALIAVAYMAGAFKEGPSSIELQLKAATEELKSFSRAISDEARNKFLADLQADLTVALNAVKSFVDEYAVYKPDPDRLEARLQDLREVEQRAAEAALKATDTKSWLQGFDNSEYSLMRPPIARYLYWQPEGSPDPVPVNTWSQGGMRFDHRLAVPFALYAVQAYLTVIKGIAPEYRTTGQFRDNLRTLATQTSTLAKNMREQGLARIIYSPHDFTIYPNEFPYRSSIADYFVDPDKGGNRLGIYPGLDPVMYLIFFAYSVGAVDLAAYTDTFLRRRYATIEERDDALSGKASVKRGQLEMLWTPWMYRWLRLRPNSWDPDACAAEANALSERAYTELLASSGYLQLVHQATLLRQLSAEPDRSETVAGKMFYTRDIEGEEPVTATSGNFLYSDPITAPARKETQRFRARARIMTQPLGRQRTIGYRIWLRSLRLEAANGARVLDPSYESAYRAYYVDDDSESTFKRLAIDFDRALVKDEVLLAERKSNQPQDILSGEGTRELKADAFDWYIPVRWLKVTRPDAADDIRRQLARFGWIEEFAPAAQASGFQELGLSLSQRYIQAARSIEVGEWQSAGPDLKGERRNLREEKCTVDWTLSWKGERLIVTVEGRPEDRNCALFLVVEEQLISRQFLHTFFPVPMNTQLTYVPSEFFEREEAAIAKDLGILSELMQPKEWEMAEGIIETVFDGFQPNEFIRQFGIAELVTRYNQNAPELVQRVLANYPGAKMPELVRERLFGKSKQKSTRRRPPRER